MRGAVSAQCLAARCANRARITKLSSIKCLVCRVNQTAEAWLKEFATTNFPRYGRGGGVGRALGVGVDLGIALGVPVGVAVGVCVAVAVAVGVAVGV